MIYTSSDDIPPPVSSWILTWEC